MSARGDRVDAAGGVFPVGAEAREGEEARRRLRQDLVRFLKLREHTRREVADYLARRGHDRELRTAALGEAVTAGLIDDRRFAEVFLRDRRRLHPMSREAVRRELRARGVAAELAEEALADCDPPWDDEVVAVELLAARWARWAPGDRRRRAERFLAARGFTRGVIRTALQGRVEAGDGAEGIGGEGRSGV